MRKYSKFASLFSVFEYIFPKTILGLQDDPALPVLYFDQNNFFELSTSTFFREVEVNFRGRSTEKVELMRTPRNLNKITPNCYIVQKYFGIKNGVISTRNKIVIILATSFGQWSLGKAVVAKRPKYECTYKMEPEAIPSLALFTENIKKLVNGKKKSGRTK